MKELKLKIEDRAGVAIRPDMFGIFFEDINYGADGGIYAELIENRSFEFYDAHGDKDAYEPVFDGDYGWAMDPGTDSDAKTGKPGFCDTKTRKEAENLKLVCNPAPGKANLLGYAPGISIRELVPLNPVNPHYLHAELEAGQGFMNQAYDGLCLKAGQKLRLSFHARTGKRLPVRIGVYVGKEGEKAKELMARLAAGDRAQTTYFSLGELVLEGREWTRYETELTAARNVRYGVFALTFEDGAKADFDCISLFPADAVCGLFRRDLAEKLKELGPKFVRFPGGCVVEGNDLANRYQWKDTVGDITLRPANWNRWAVHMSRPWNEFHNEFCHYNQTLGLGYYEYFMLCEYLGAAPVPVANVGLACQYQGHQLVRRDDPAYESFIRDVLDLIEFANGPADSIWGSVRARMGHPAPFGLAYIGIGNEQWQTEQVDFFERYDDFEQRIHEVYPEIRLLGSAGPTVGTETYRMAWENYRAKCRGTAAPEHTYAVDEHYYMEPEWFLNNTHFYDEYPRDVRVFSGEYAAHDPQEEENALTHNNLRAAVAEAAFLTGVERNADVVALACYAPLFARIGYIQWHPDLIWFDDRDCYGTPSFYVQKLYAGKTGDETLPSCLEGAEDREEERRLGIYAAASRRKENGELYVKLVNASAEDRELVLELPEDLTKGLEHAELSCMTGDPLAANSLTAPERIVPRKAPELMTTAADSADSLKKGSLTVKLPACSVSLVTLT